MTRFLLAIVVLLALAAAACGGSSAATPTPTSPPPQPTPLTKQLAIETATEGLLAYEFRDEYYEVTAEHLAARDGARVLQQMGVGELPLYDPTPTCSSASFGCGGFGGVQADSSGWLVLLTGWPAAGFEPAGDHKSRVVKATWIADAGTLIGFTAAYPTATVTPEDEQILIERTDWQLKTPPAGNALTLIVPVGGSCQIFARTATSETDDTVTIHAYVVSEYHPDSACAAYLVSEEVTVDLGAPVGDRKLLGCDGRTQYPYVDLVDDDGKVDCTLLSR